MIFLHSFSKRVCTEFNHVGAKAQLNLQHW
jgi:hypothetical protein